MGTGLRGAAKVRLMLRLPGIWARILAPLVDLTGPLLNDLSDEPTVGACPQTIPVARPATMTTAWSCWNSGSFGCGAVLIGRFMEWFTSLRIVKQHFPAHTTYVVLCRRYSCFKT
jgi:hypothetical protein